MGRKWKLLKQVKSLLTKKKHINVKLESYDSEGDILEESVDKLLKPYQFEPEKEVITDNDESKEDSEQSDGGSQNLATNECIGNTAWCECSQCNFENRETDKRLQH